MELDELKSAWQSLQQQLAKQNALQLQALLESRQARGHRILRPLVWGQTFQMGCGALLMLYAAPFWVKHLHTPHLLVAGLVLHLYGLALLLFGARMHALLSAVDFSAPVVEIQSDLARLRRFYVRTGTFALGLPWWVLWIPLMMMALKSLVGADLYTAAPRWASLSLAIGGIGWILSLVLIRSARLSKAFERAAAGRSLREAQRQLDDIARFERD